MAKTARINLSVLFIFFFIYRFSLEPVTRNLNIIYPHGE